MEQDADQVYRQLLQSLQNGLELKCLAMGLFLDRHGYEYCFPEIDMTTVDEEPNEDGYVEVKVSPLLFFEGKRKIRDGLERMLRSMVLVG